MTESALKQNLIPDKKIAYWELNNNTSFWSKAFIKQLKFKPREVDTSLNYFLDSIIHENYREAFKDNFYNLVRNDVDFRQKLLLKNRSGGYSEFICKTNDELKISLNKESTKTIFFFKSKLKTHKKVRDNNFYYLETATMTSTGSWYIDFEKKKSYWDDITRKILEYPEDFIPSLKMAYKLYSEEHQALASSAFFECSLSGKPFDLEILMVTAKNRKFWARAMGKPVFNDNKEIVGLRGIFQDIDDIKQKELYLEKTSKIIETQNSRLFNFAHIVSHNLRSHSSNLSLIMDLIGDVESKEEKLELINNIKDVSNSLNTTIEHLNEVVTIQTNAQQSKEIVSLSKTLDQVTTSINQIIKSKKVTIVSDFSKGDKVNYIPAYMDSILLNLITNAIKYKHAERDPLIEISTLLDFKDNDRLVLNIKDNGSGIDLDKFGDKLFGMYKTFHYNEDARGIGLFITKNQIESLNGEINVASIVNVGTTFTIKF
ncbi:PAS domain-containing sensor histidine kinase [Winogradskyella flava]|uniref:histidine kinase n=1 Tax=Winogradskyella flava TaxID=1884876 RepID=A0A842IRN8_9FLAO|nr:PAS domain-containing sensor histidine kinase [Winogradskyella flava]MBC2843548.1 PAS domain-containing sensor histidine kinase [Winogradskyella flava]